MLRLRVPCLHTNGHPARARVRKGYRVVTAWVSSRSDLNHSGITPTGTNPETTNVTQANPRSSVYEELLRCYALKHVHLNRLNIRFENG